MPTVVGVWALSLRTGVLKQANYTLVLAGYSYGCPGDFFDV